MNKKAFGKRLNAVRKNEQMSSELLSDKIGKSSGAYIRQIEAGINGISIEALVTVCNILNVSADYLLADSLSLNNNLFDKSGKLTPAQYKTVMRMIDTMIAENESSSNEE